MREVLTLLWAKGRIARHTVASVRHESKLKIVVISVAALTLWVLAFVVFYAAFDYVVREADEIAAGLDLGLGVGASIGNFLMSRLLAVFSVSIFMLLAFSNILIAFATFYRAKEVPYLLHAPLSGRQYFYARFIECIGVSSWSLAYLGSPLMLAYGITTGASPVFYLAVIVFYIPYITIPAALGALGAMALVRVFPALKTRTMILLGVAGVGAFFLYLRTIARTTDFDEDALVPLFLDTSSQLQANWLPSAWAYEGVLAAAQANYADSLFLLGVLVANAMLLLFVGGEVAEGLVHRGYSILAGQDRQRIHRANRGVINLIVTPLLAWVRNPQRSLVIKDIKLFWRDPTQWSQFVIFFGVLAIYFANLHRTSTVTEDSFWRSWIACLNVGSISLILATLTSRFVFPLISLEGRRFWILSLAPLTYKQLVWQKFWLSVGTASVFTVALAIVSGRQLGLEPTAFWLTIYSVVLVNFGLSGLAVGLGTLYPNFQEDNPARIVSGMGGTLNLLLSIGYIGCIVAAQVIVLQWSILGPAAGTQGHTTALVSVLVFITVLSGICTFLPMRLGLRNLLQHEF